MVNTSGKSPTHPEIVNGNDFSGLVRGGSTAVTAQRAATTVELLCASVTCAWGLLPVGGINNYSDKA